MATPTHYTEKRQSTLPRKVNISSQIPTPTHQEITRNMTQIVKIRAKDHNLGFDGKDAVRFIKKAENIAEIKGARGRDIASQIAFWTKYEEISYHIEGIPGYETADWDQLKVDIKRRWGKVSPERRYRLSSMTDLFTKTQKEGGIRNMTQYRKFIGEYEAIITYLKRYQYIQGDTNHNQETFASLSTSVQERSKELNQKIKYPPQPEPQPRNEGKESVKEVLNEVKTLSEAVNPPLRNWNNNQEQILPQNNQPYRPRNPLTPFSSSYQPYIPAQMAPRPPLKCAYFKEEGHSATRCTQIAEDLDRRIVRTQGASYLFPNYQRVPMEGNESAKNIVRAFAKEEAELNKKSMEKPVVKKTRRRGEAH
ncbi:hypothetical protein O181_099829 [Austropuccinia psidii MF-1]|uniref:Uncharacterized protein n=1 Tax=Austropuccinia psidii MF-1 TaxID=1389203 RepID=A0A9Q3JDF8_9BASI|nr:hypothetical protein [Austropuccinia psidii MF-1]